MSEQNEQDTVRDSQLIIEDILSGRFVGVFCIYFIWWRFDLLLWVTLFMEYDV